MPPNPFTQFFGNRASLSDEDEQKQERSWAELKAGRLPLSAQERLATQSEQGVFTSALSARDLAAVRAAGYQPVGQAFGTATFRLNRLTFAGYQIHPNAYLGSSRYGSLRINPVMIGSFHEGERQARTKAIERMTAECQALGGDGVIGAEIRRSRPSHDLYEFTVIGTVVRQDGRARRAEEVPFVTTMSAAQVGRLDAGGWRPVSLLFELQRFAGHAGYVGFGGGRLNPNNYQVGEVTAATEVLEYGRTRIRQLLNARLPARGGMILDSLTTEVERAECSAIDGQSDFLVDVEAIGTAIEPVPDHRPRPSRPGLKMTPVLPLNDRGELS
jgi:hypothetical protein